MNDTPTPRTDALGYIPTDIAPAWPLVEHARDLERQLAEATAALQWAQSQLGKHSRPSPIDKALASIRQPLPNPPTEKP